mmetsp:Transcript_13977/g.39746  ORF Transcript_13977/g.39746 Transcript_13977/m.39746 type:complete len:238 (-) Transcript_13977:380-1093(-)
MSSHAGVTAAITESTCRTAGDARPDATWELFFFNEAGMPSAAGHDSSASPYGTSRRARRSGWFSSSGSSAGMAKSERVHQPIRIVSRSAPGTLPPVAAAVASLVLVLVPALALVLVTVSVFVLVRARLRGLSATGRSASSRSFPFPWPFSCSRVLSVGRTPCKSVPGKVIKAPATGGTTHAREAIAVASTSWSNTTVGPPSGTMPSSSPPAEMYTTELTRGCFTTPVASKSSSSVSK